LIDDSVPIKDAALATGIKLGSAYNYRKLHVMDPNNGVPYRKRRGRKGSYYKLKEEHANFIIKHIDENPIAFYCKLKRYCAKPFLV
jgi:hypothetical protein